MESEPMMEGTKPDGSDIGDGFVSCIVCGRDRRQGTHEWRANFQTHILDQR